MDLYQLRTFLVVAAEKSITRAAQRLFTTPPSVSGHIKALEDEWGVALFRRTAKGMEITAKGEQLRLKAEATLLAAQDLANHATDLQGYLMGALRIGVNTSADALRVPKLVEHLQNRCPGVELRLVQGASARIVDDLERGLLDAGFIFGRASAEKIGSHHLMVAELVVTAPKAWESDIRGATWEKVAELPWIRSGGSCPFQLTVDKLFAERGLQQRCAVGTDDDATRAELVGAGVGIALMEQWDAQRAVDRGIAVVWKTESIQCDLSFAYLLSRKEDPLVRALRMAVLDVWDLVRDVSLPERRAKS